jgi:hypothetical protein
MINEFKGDDDRHDGDDDRHDDDDDGDKDDKDNYEYDGDYAYDLDDNCFHDNHHLFVIWSPGLNFECNKDDANRNCFRTGCYYSYDDGDHDITIIVITTTIIIIITTTIIIIHIIIIITIIIIIIIIIIIYIYR